MIRFAIPAVCACGAPPVLGHGSPYNRDLEITCHCPDCYGDEGEQDDAWALPNSALIVGYGPTEQAALEDFWSGVAEEWEMVL